jgi:hypothetical protein
MPVMMVLELAMPSIEPVVIDPVASVAMKAEMPR